MRSIAAEWYCSTIEVESVLHYVLAVPLALPTERFLKPLLHGASALNVPR